MQLGCSQGEGEFEHEGRLHEESGFAKAGCQFPAGKLPASERLLHADGQLARQGQLHTDGLLAAKGRRCLDLLLTKELRIRMGKVLARDGRVSADALLA